MNITEAYNIFNLKPTDSLEDFKKKHKELVKKYHPDINKEPNAQKKMSEVNEAFDIIKKHKEGKHFNNQHFQAEDITIYKDITFADAVYGCQVNVKYDRQVHCQICDGSGTKRISDCKVCNGSGVVEKIEKSSFGTTISRTNCRSCIGKFKEEQCNDCYGLGNKKESVDINVRIPPGVKPYSRLTLRDMGNFGLQASIFGPQLIYKDAYIVVNYQEDKNIKIVGKNLETELNISFLESIKGFEKIITLPDESKINIDRKEQTKNSHKIIFPNKGVAREGSLEVKIVVDDIPQKHINKIVEILENESNN